MASKTIEATSTMSLRTPRYRLLTLLVVVPLLGALIVGVAMRWNAAERDRESISVLRGLLFDVGYDEYRGDEWDHRFNPSVNDYYGAQIEYVSVSKDTIRGPIDERVLHAICRLSSLRHLNLKGMSLSGLSLEPLNELPCLETIALDDTDTADEQIAGLGNQSALKCLRLSGTSITDQSLVSVARFSQLASLDVSNTAITDGGLRELENCDQLEIVWVSGTQTTEAGLDQLRSALPGCEVVSH
ncbi:hypothetical protein DTL21_17455 [Bremerella cremea]|uniref:Leucine Rich repeats (2 copies) n=1 Tax=Blastopirellula marina TaxID=124 RepID=A0A2S8FIQ2_9BACT|nr:MULTISPECIES: hypothetical protein [Pirellulaceae]PQO32031.1 hypothetical protein C5Y83_17440 [Blastopirellula marina]RCS45097.1 hypothetical protein DTL21_17455 [Bremerella cremea]